MISSPFKFLDSYTKADKDIFFGRESEVEDVYTKIFQGKILLVYGASGTGKSSLISCGLANKFDDADWLPVNIRRGLNINDSLNQQLEKQMITPAAAVGAPLPKILKSVYLDHFKPIFLIFDQFEELFIFGEREEWMAFARSVRTVLDSSLQARFVFIIRGEYLEYLTDLEEILPELFTNRLRIEKMTRAKAVRCITGPCEAYGISVEDHFAENLLNKLSPSKTEIELTYLQVFLDRIFKKASETAVNEKVVFSNALLNDLGNVGDVLSQFLDEQIELIPESENALAVLKAFVSTDATKKQITVEQAAGFVQTIGKPMEISLVDRLIQELVNRRIIKDKDEAGRYELRHDSIAVKIFEKITNYERDLIEVSQFINYAFGEHQKRNFMLNESDLTYIQPYESKFNLSSEVQSFIQKSKAIVRKKKRSRKQLYAVFGVISLLLVVSLVSLVYAFVQQVVANKQAAIALEQKQEAEKQKLEAVRQREMAIKLLKLSDSLRRIGELERKRADSLLFNFDKIVPMVLGPTMLPLGTRYSGNLFLAGASSSHRSQMFKDNEPIKVTKGLGGVEFGEIEFVATADTFDYRGMATKHFTATIQVKGKPPLVRTIDYTVIRPLIRVTNGNAPTLYLNCGNAVNFEVPALGPAYNPSFTISGGLIVKTEMPGKVIVIPKALKIDVGVSNAGVLIGTISFNTKVVPKPHYIVKDNKGKLVDLINGIPSSEIGVESTRLGALKVIAEAEANVRSEVPKDSNYEIQSMEVILARGTERVDYFTVTTGELELQKFRGVTEPGDRIIIDIKQVVRLTFDGEQELVEVTNGTLTVPIQ